MYADVQWFPILGDKTLREVYFLLVFSIFFSSTLKEKADVTSLSRGRILARPVGFHFQIRATEELGTGRAETIFPVPNRVKSLRGWYQLHQSSCVPQYRSNREPPTGDVGWAIEHLFSRNCVQHLPQPQYSVSPRSWHNPSGKEDWKGPKYVQMEISRWPGRMAAYRKLGNERFPIQLTKFAQ